MQRWMPATTWLRGLTPAGLRGDVIAGITLAAYLLPSAIADASLAGLPLQAGLYACLFGGPDVVVARNEGAVREALRRVGNAGASELAEADQTVDIVLSKWRAGAAATG